jgi:hypothetical protein
VEDRQGTDDVPQVGHTDQEDALGIFQGRRVG